MSKLSFFLANAAKRFPNLAVVERRIATQEMTIEEVRRELWNRRLEFWFRKIQGIPETWQAAKVRCIRIRRGILRYSDAPVDYNLVGMTALVLRHFIRSFNSKSSYLG